MSVKNIHSAYFIGIGGIGMSALARYFNSNNTAVAGYDRVSTSLTDDLEKEGIEIHFSDDPQLIPGYLFDVPREETLVVYTPAIPPDHREMNFLKKEGFNLVKRSEALANLTLEKFSIAVAGTHGKTTVTSMIAHLLMDCDTNFTAFIGGILKDYETNYLTSRQDGPEIMVVEADEFDRSFHRLQPDVAVITSVEADHLDVYENTEGLRSAFLDFAGRMRPSGKLLVHEDFSQMFSGATSYGTNGDYHYSINSTTDDLSEFVLSTPAGEELTIKAPITGKHNIENAVAGLAACHISGVDAQKLSSGLEDYPGVKRRFEKVIETPDLIYIDDYAHHPTELRESISAAREKYKGKDLTVIFQPHLYSRTRDFADGFAESLSLADNILLMDIYPARELPIEGVSSEIILQKIKGKNARLVNKDEIPELMAGKKDAVIMTLGAGDIDRLVEPIKNALKES